MPTNTCGESISPEFAVIGCKVLDDYMEAFNTGDVKRWCSVLHFPHVRIAGDKIMLWNNPEDFAKDNDLSLLTNKINWGYNKWEWRNMVQFGPGKIHFTVFISRYTVNDVLISSFESLYIIARINNRWAVQGRSSYAGIFAGNTGY